MTDADAIFCGGEGQLWEYHCVDDIKFEWDQWVRCTITCTHGTYSGVSNGLTGAIGQSLGRAFERFMADAGLHDRDE